MKICILDAYTTNPGDLSWDFLGDFGEYTVYERTPAELIYERCAGCDIVITNKTPLRAQTLEKLTDLKYIGLLSTGYNIADVDWCKAHGIPVCNIPSYSTSAVAQLTFALITHFTNAVAIHSDAVHAGEWSANPDFCFWKTPLIELSAKVLGIIGFGKIGKAVAQIAKAYGMKILASGGSTKVYDGVEFVDRDTLLANSDFVSLHCPLTPETECMVNAEFLGKMKPTAFLINTSRGQVIDENALACALRNGKIAGAGLDVLCTEPPAADCPLLGCENAVITPHIAWAGFETRERLVRIFRENLEGFMKGKIQNNVWDR